MMSDFTQTFSWRKTPRQGLNSSNRNSSIRPIQREGSEAVIELILSLRALADALCQAGVSGGQNVEFLLFFE
jgi:hypothetical protein